jgi:peroxiredoxin
MTRRPVRWTRGLVLGAALAAALSGARCAAPAGLERANLDFTLKDMNGRDVRLADLRGKALVVNFWATWCEPCQVETPQLEKLARRYADQGLAIVGISTEDSADQIRTFAAQFKVSYPLLVGLDRTDVQSAFGWTGLLPTSVFVRKDGTIAGRLEGIETEDYWNTRIQALF